MPKPEQQMESSPDSNASGKTFDWDSSIHEAWKKGTVAVKEQPLLAGAALMVGSLVIHDGKNIASTAKMIGKDVFHKSEREALAQAGALVKARFPGAQIIESAGKEISEAEFASLRTGTQSHAFGAITHGDELQAVRIPSGGFNLDQWSDSYQLLKKTGPDKWLTASGSNTSARIELHHASSGPELHVYQTQRGSEFKSIHFADGSNALEHVQTGARVEVDTLFRTPTHMRDVNGVSYSASYDGTKLTGLTRTNSDGVKEELRVRFDGQGDGFEMGRGWVYEVKGETGLFHAMDGNVHSDWRAAQDASSGLITNGWHDWSGLSVKSNFPSQYKGGIARHRGGFHVQISKPIDVSDEEAEFRQVVTDWRNALN